MHVAAYENKKLLGRRGNTNTNLYKASRQTQKFHIELSSKSSSAPFQSNLKMFTPIALVVTVASLFTAISAYPQTLPNVALFNLGVTVTPPAGQILRLVYLGYGI
jgi:hypothetical protein